MDSKIVVVGSINVDLVINSDRIPMPGETINGGEFHIISGGKGANQAVAAARQAIPTAFVGCVGDDDFGNSQKANLKNENIDTDHIIAIENQSTGVAVIVVTADGNNRIILSSGANGGLSPDKVEKARDVIAGADILICQLEIPLPSVKKALEIARQHQTVTILNPAPAMMLDSSVLNLADYLVLNETEAAVLSGVTVADRESGQCAARKLSRTCQGTIMITMGEQGVLTRVGETPNSRSSVFHIDAIPAKVKDTTAAGDTYIGTLAAALIWGDVLETAVKKAIAAATITITKTGAQTSIPEKTQFEQFMSKLKRNEKK